VLIVRDVPHVVSAAKEVSTPVTSRPVETDGAARAASLLADLL
jgi:hypothetical protein